MIEIYGTIELMLAPEPRWELVSNPLYKMHDNRVIKPQAGFMFDGGSIPRVFWTLVGHPLSHRGIRGYLLHDWLYAKSREGSYHCTRRQADEWLLDVLLYDRMDPITAHGIYTAVRGASYPFWGDGIPDERANLLEDPAGFEWFRE